MQDDILHELKEQTRWLRLLGIRSLGSAIKDIIVTKKQLKVYELSDGKRSSREIAKAAGVSAGTVSRLWNIWDAQGIVYESDLAKGRMTHLLHPKDVGFTEDELEPE